MFLVFLAEGFEEVEALTVVDYLRRVGVDVKTVSITEDLEVLGAHGIKVLADCTFEDFENFDSVRGLTIPGGLLGARNLQKSEKVVDLVKSFYEEEKLVSAICAGPVVLKEAGVTEGKSITFFPGFEEELEGAEHHSVGALRDGNVVTGKGPFFAVDFAIELVSFLEGEEKVKELKESILYE